MRLLLTSSSFMTPVFTQGKAIALDCKDCRSEVKDNVILFLSPLCKTMLWSFLLLGTPVWVFQVLDGRPVYLKLPFLFSQLLKKGPDVALEEHCTVQLPWKSLWWKTVKSVLQCTCTYLYTILACTKCWYICPLCQLQFLLNPSGPTVQAGTSLSPPVSTHVLPGEGIIL